MYPGLPCKAEQSSQKCLLQTLLICLAVYVPCSSPDVKHTDAEAGLHAIFWVRVEKCYFSQLLNTWSPNKSQPSASGFTPVEATAPLHLHGSKTLLLFFTRYLAARKITESYACNRIAGTRASHFCFVGHMLKCHILNCHIMSIFTNWVYLLVFGHRTSYSASPGD